jgi:transposase
MLSLPPSVRIYVAKDPADMRKSFNGLSALVVSTIQRDPLSGHLFVFRNKRRDRVSLCTLLVYSWQKRGVVHAVSRSFSRSAMNYGLYAYLHFVALER